MKISRRQLRQIIQEEYSKINTSSRKQEVRKQLIAEGWLDKFKAKVYGVGGQLERQIASVVKGKKEDLPAGMTQAELTQGMKELYFVAHARGNFAKRLEKMAEEMENDIKDMGFGEGAAKDELEEIAELLRKSAKEIENVKDILRARKDEFEF